MMPDRKEIINKQKIEEYYWAGKKVVYIDNRLSEMTFNEACNKLKNNQAKDEKANT